MMLLYGELENTYTSLQVFKHIRDGKVEIALGREVGAITLGIASDEEKRSGINSIKISYEKIFFTPIMD